MTEEKLYRVPNIETHLIESGKAGRKYQIQVMQPLMHKHQAGQFPVLYLTDGNPAFDFAKGISQCLQSAGLTCGFILVGIGYPGDNPFAGDILRCRDLTPEGRAQIPGIPRSSPVDGVAGVAQEEPVWGGGAQFLSFIRDELVPFIDRTYPTITEDRGYFGHSLGAGLGLHALLAGAPLFRRYILSSPGVSYAGDDFGIREAEAAIASGKILDARVYMSVGDREEFEPDFTAFQMVSSFYRLVALLRAGSIAGLDLKSEVILGETHASVWPVAFSHGVQAIYPPRRA